MEAQYSRQYMWKALVGAFRMSCLLYLAIAFLLAAEDRRRPEPCSSMKVENIDVDQIWRDLGSFGRFTWKQIGCYLMICVSWIVHQLTIVFIGYRPNYKCRAPDVNLTGQTAGNNNQTYTEYGECSIKTFYNSSHGNNVTETSCIHGWEYDIPREQSFVTEWDFVCENAELAELTQSLLTVGMMIGTFVCPPLSDKYGRKPVMVATQIILLGITLGTAFSPNYYVYLVLRFVTGMVAQGALSGTTLSLESLPTEVRSNEEVLALILWTSGVCMISPISYAFRNLSWRYAQITFALFGTWSLFQWWILDESLRWVIANGQIERAKAIIKRACKWNNKDYDTIIRKSGLDKVHRAPRKNITEEEADGAALAEKETLVSDENEVSAPRYSIFAILTNKAVLKVSLIIWVLWITDSLVYYGLYMVSSDLYGNRYVNFFLSAISEFPAALFEYLAFNRLGRKWTCLVSHIVAGVGLVVATALQYASTGNTAMLAASTALTLIGKMAITAGFSSAFLLTPELYPTNMRNTGLGIASFMGKVGAMIAPFFRNLSELVPWLPGAIFSLMIVITVILLAFVPETNGVDLPQTMDELSEWYKVNKFSFKIGKNEAVVKSKEKETEVINLNEKQ